MNTYEKLSSFLFLSSLAAVIAEGKFRELIQGDASHMLVTRVAEFWRKDSKMVSFGARSHLLKVNLPKPLSFTSVLAAYVSVHKYLTWQFTWNDHLFLLTVSKVSVHHVRKSVGEPSSLFQGGKETKKGTRGRICGKTASNDTLTGATYPTRCHFLFPTTTQ